MPVFNAGRIFGKLLSILFQQLGIFRCLVRVYSLKAHVIVTSPILLVLAEPHVAVQTSENFGPLTVSCRLAPLAILKACLEVKGRLVLSQNEVAVFSGCLVGLHLLLILVTFVGLRTLFPVFRYLLLKSLRIHKVRSLVAVNGLKTRTFDYIAASVLTWEVGTALRDVVGRRVANLEVCAGKSQALVRNKTAVKLALFAKSLVH